MAIRIVKEETFINKQKNDILVRATIIVTKHEWDMFKGRLHELVQIEEQRKKVFTEIFDIELKPDV